MDLWNSWKYFKTVFTCNILCVSKIANFLNYSRVLHNNGFDDRKMDRNN